MLNNKKTLLTLGPLFLVLIIDMMGIGLVIPILAPLFLETSGGLLPEAASFALRNFLYGLTLASFAICMFFGAPLLGDLSDSWGRKKVLLLCLFGTAISYVISGLGIAAHSVTLLILGRCVAGFLAGSQPIAQAAIADVSTPENKMTNMSYMIFAACIGFIIGPLLGGYFTNTKLVSWFSYATPFYVASILALINGLLLIYTFRETYQPIMGRKLQLAKGFLMFLAAFSGHSIRNLVWVLLLSQLAFSVYFTFISLFFVKVYAYDAIRVSHFMMYYAFIWAITFTTIVKYANKRFTLNQLGLMTLCLTVIGMAGTLLPGEISQWLTAIPLSVGNGLSYTALLAMLSNSVDKDSQGWVMGVAGAVVASSWSIGPLLASSGSYGVYLPFILSLLLLCCSVICFLRTVTFASKKMQKA